MGRYCLHGLKSIESSKLTVTYIQCDIADAHEGRRV